MADLIKIWVDKTGFISLLTWNIQHVIISYRKVFLYKNLHHGDSSDISMNILRPRQMAAILHMTFYNAFSWMKMYEFW